MRLASPPRNELPTLGPCCVCGGEKHVVNIVMLPHRGAIPGRGWGCVVCNLPAEGAIAVLCNTASASRRNSHAAAIPPRTGGLPSPNCRKRSSTTTRRCTRWRKGSYDRDARALAAGAARFPPRARQADARHRRRLATSSARSEGRVHMTASKIEWTDRSDWNPLRGCTRVSPGCGGPGDHGGCYAEAMAARFSQPGMWGRGYAEMVQGKPRWTGKVELQADRLTLPLSWKNPAKVFASSTSDFFHEKLSDEDGDKLFAVMALCPHLAFQVLTKRPERMRRYLFDDARQSRIAETAMEMAPVGRDVTASGLVFAPRGVPGVYFQRWSLPNVWLGVSIERQEEADDRVPLLLNTPAAVRFVSAEPLLGPIDLSRICLQPQRPGSIRAGIHLNSLAGRYSESGVRYTGDWDISGPAPGPETPARKLDWVIAGGESGARARPMHPDWARRLRNQCRTAGVPFFFKQWGEWAPIEAAGKEPHKKFRTMLVDPDGKAMHDADAGPSDFSDDARFVYRVGRASTGCLLDHIEHKAFPVPRI